MNTTMLLFGDAREPQPAARPTGATVLYVDDCPTTRCLIHGTLARHGYHLIEAADAAEALDLARVHQPDLLLVDVLMPAMDGYEMVRQLRADSMLSNMRVIFLSGAFWEPEARELARQHGALDFVLKPIEPKRLVRLVKEALQQEPLPALPLEELAATNAAHVRLLEAKLLQTTHRLHEEMGWRKCAQAAVARASRLLDLAQEAIVEYAHSTGEIVAWNGGAERIFGWTAHEAIGRGFRELLPTMDLDTDAALNTALEEAGEWCGEMRQPTKDGRQVVVHARALLVQDERGAARSVQLIQTDITEHKKLEEQFLRAQRLESIGELAGGVAHDLKNILSAVILSAPVLREELPGRARNEVVDTIETAALRGAEIVKHVLDFARGGDGTRSVVQPAKVIQEVGRMVRDTFPESIELRIRTERCCSALRADATQLHQVLLNLCLNARDAMPEGGQLTLSCTDVMLEEGFAAGAQSSKGGSHVLIEVSDTGTGIAEELLDRIFDPFFTTKPPGKGTGLGLSTTKTIVQEHGGFCDVQSSLGRGSTFKVYLPAVGPLVQPPAPRADGRDGEGQMVLIVDDDPGIRQVASRRLKLHGYRTLEARDGVEALSLFYRHSEEIRHVITDVMMPGLNGLALARTIREHKPGTHIIAITGFREQMAEIDFESADVSEWLNKPFTSEKLLKVIQRTEAGPELIPASR